MYVVLVTLQLATLLLSADVLLSLLKLKFVFFLSTVCFTPPCIEKNAFFTFSLWTKPLDKWELLISKGLQARLWRDGGSVQSYYGLFFVDLLSLLRVSLLIVEYLYDSFLFIDLFILAPITWGKAS